MREMHTVFRSTRDTKNSDRLDMPEDGEQRGAYCVHGAHTPIACLPDLDTAAVAFSRSSTRNAVIPQCDPDGKVCLKA